MRILLVPLLLAALPLCAFASTANAPRSAPAARHCADDADWNDPAAPRHIHGNTWYVGTCGISALLITGSQGHVLVDVGTEQSAPLIEANIRALGFRVEDIRAIVGSHAHNDHAGGLAKLQRDSGAMVYARAPAISVLSTGVVDRSDPQFLVLKSFPPVANLKPLRDGDHVTVGDIDLTAIATPGHTAGGTSWTWRECEKRRCLRMAFVDSLSPAADGVYRYSDEASHPGVVAAFRTTVATVAAVPCDVLITPHPSASNLWSRIDMHPTMPLVSAGACRALADTAALRLNARLAKEAQPR